MGEKLNEQVDEVTFAEYLHQTAQLGATTRDRQLRRSAFIDGIQGRVFTFIHQGVSQAAACDGLIYMVYYNGQNVDIQGYPVLLLLLFED